MASVRRLSAIMLTDIADYTAVTQNDERAALRLVEDQEDLVRSLLTQFRGREIKSTGDGFLIAFESALDAVQCGVELQRRIHDRNSRRIGHPLSLRVGIHLGDIQQRGEDIFGDAVNITSRVEALADPGGVCLTEQVFAQVNNKLLLQFERLCPKPLKGIREPVTLYRVRIPWSSPDMHREEGKVPRIAVLPLTNISPDPNDAYFADGLTEELIATLSQLRGLRVIARTSVSRYKATSKSIGEIGAELGVGTVLEGSVRKSGDQLRITLQLIDARTEEHRWAQTFDRTLDRVFSVQAEIAERTAESMKLELLQEDRAAIRRGSAPNSVAYEHYLRGLADRRNQDFDIPTNVGHFEAAIRADPDFALAYSALANALIGAAGEHLPTSETFPRARDLIEKALELDPAQSEAHVARGNLAFQMDLDWAGAEAEFQRALALNPSSSTTCFWYGMCLACSQRYDQAREQFLRGLELDPDQASSAAWLTWVEYLVGDLDACIQRAKQALSRFTDAKWPYVSLALAYVDMGRIVEAASAIDRAPGVGGQPEVLRASLLARVGRVDEARTLLHEWTEASKSRYVPAERLAALHASLREGSEAVAVLERDYAEGERSLWFSYQWQYYDGIRDDPRFQKLLTKYGVPRDPPPRIARGLERSSR